MSLYGCGTNSAYAPPPVSAPILSEMRPSIRPNPAKPIEKRESRDFSWTYRTITEREILRISDKDPELSPSIIRGILARLNVKSRYYIADDIKAGQKLKVPNNFSAFKKWTPLPHSIPELANVPKAILIVKDIPFLGWYERGKLEDDTQICIGKTGSRTDAGIFSVKEKDADHISRSYKNALGEPAPMPWALRIYGTVWIHAGDIVNGYCSHGCINLPVPTAVELYEWTDKGAPVLIVESLRELKTVLRENRSNCTLYAEECARKKMVKSVESSRPMKNRERLAERFDFKAISMPDDSLAHIYGGNQ